VTITGDYFCYDQCDQSNGEHTALNLNSYLGDSVLYLLEEFGNSIAADYYSQDIIVVGAPEADRYNYHQTGKIYIYKHNRATGSITLAAMFSALADFEVADELGHNVAIFEKTIVAGDKDSAYIIEKTSNPANDGWVPLYFLSDLTPESSYNEYGVQVDIDGKTVVMGNDSNNAVWVFTGDNPHTVPSLGPWALQQKLTAPEGEGFGNSVSIEGDTLVIGGNDGMSACVYIYTRDESGVWTLQTKVRGDTSASVRWGHNIDIAGATLAVGDDLGGVAGQGYVDIFTGTGDSWQFSATISGDDLQAWNRREDHFGRGLKLRANQGTVADYDLFVISDNFVYVFRGGGTIWEKVGRYEADLPESVALSGDLVVTGHIAESSAIPEIGNGTYQGFVQALNLEEQSTVNTETIVEFNNTAVPFVQWSLDQRLEFLVPDDVLDGAATVSVITSYGQATQNFTVLAELPPVVDSIFQASGPEGAFLFILGANFCLNDCRRSIVNNPDITIYSGCASLGWVEALTPGMIKIDLAGIDPDETITVETLWGAIEVDLEGIPVISTGPEPGDINGDGLVNIADILLVERIGLGLLEPSTDQLQGADVAPPGHCQQDGVVDGNDILLIKRNVLGLSD